MIVISLLPGTFVGQQNYGSSESRETHAVAPKSERQIMSYVDLCILLSIVVGVDGCEVQILRVDPRLPKLSQTCEPSMASPQ
jgi:hypothetical protein